VQESRARGAETLRRRREAAWAKGASAPQWMTLGECYIVYDIDSDILLFDIERFIFDIEREKGLRYCIRYQSTISNNDVWYRRDET
jgi:phosphoribosyl-AMP cyclohydrolase